MSGEQLEEARAGLENVTLTEESGSGSTAAGNEEPKGLDEIFIQLDEELERPNKELEKLDQELLPLATVFKRLNRI